MGLGLFLLPVLGGYWFLTQVYFTRYPTLRDSGYHVFFRSATTGVALASLARAIIEVLNHYLPGVGSAWKGLVPLSYAGTAIGAFLLGLMLPLGINLVYGREKASRRAALTSGDLIESLWEESLENQKLVELSLHGGKVYIGFAVESAVGRDSRADLAILPMASGYRDKDTQEMVIVRNYAEVFERALDGADRIDGLASRDFRVIVPRSEIRSGRLFDPVVYERFRHGIGDGEGGVEGVEG